MFEKQERYKSSDGQKDLIDEWAEKYSRDEFRAIMRAQVEKYYSRYGKKDNVVSESRKAADYAMRLHQYEVKWASEINPDLEKAAADIEAASGMRPSLRQTIKDAGVSVTS